MPTSAPLSVRPARTTVSRRIGGSVVALNASTGRYFQLDKSGGALWDFFIDRSSVDDAAARMAQRYGIDIARARDDVDAFVAAALRDGLLEEGTQPLRDSAEGSVTIASGRMRVVGDVAAMQATFARQHFVQIPMLLTPALLEHVTQLIDAGEFVDRAHDGIGTELCLVPGVATGTLQLLFNDPELRELVGAIAGIPAPGCFDGRVYRMSPREGHYDSWHSDAGEDRQIAVSLNLSPRQYEGGELELRRATERDAEWVVSNHVFGSAVMFRISPQLRHRVVAVRGSHPRTAYAGWFRTVPAFEDLFLPTLRSA